MASNRKAVRLFMIVSCWSRTNRDKRMGMLARVLWSLLTNRDRTDRRWPLTPNGHFEFRLRYSPSRRRVSSTGRDWQKQGRDAQARVVAAIAVLVLVISRTP